MNLSKIVAMNIVNVILRAISSILFLSLFAANQSSAQPTFIQHTIYETIYTSSIYFGHFDDDGDIDLATTTPISDRQGNPYGDAVFWWENDGLQNFTSHAITNNFPHARFVYISDMDMDGDSDILAGAETTNGIRWWENSGNYPPIFEEHVIGFGYRRAHAVLASDLDGDDDIDVVGIGNDAIDLVWFENDGVMDFTEHTIDTSVFVIQDMEIVDFNDNGNNDIITVAQYPYEKVSIFINTGGQPIEFEEIIVSRDIFRTIQHIDLDRDSDIDLICAGYDSGIKWFENTGNFTFVEHSIDRYMWRAGTGRSLKAIDVDCDGDIDFVDGVGDGFSNNGIGYIRWWENDGFQDFTIR
ncbi:MAG: VCBS repeat-containing protein, partial [Candidatus Electryonea clarkiae]|nr:VCBS repeat-containing protein [Candidatus Electryonea clarkiae]